MERLISISKSEIEGIIKSAVFGLIDAASSIDESSLTSCNVTVSPFPYSFKNGLTFVLIDSIRDTMVRLKNLTDVAQNFFVFKISKKITSNGPAEEVQYIVEENMSQDVKSALFERMKLLSNGGIIDAIKESDILLGLMFDGTTNEKS